MTSFASPQCRLLPGIWWRCQNSNWKSSGSVAEWQSFQDAFKNAVHNNSQLPETDKFTYLKGLLAGKANSAIVGLSLTQGNCEAMIEIFENRIGKKKKIISAHKEMLLKLPPVYNGKETGKPWKLYDEIEARIQGLRSMGIQADPYGTLLVLVLLSKLPEDEKWENSCVIEDGKWNLDDLLKKSIAEVTARERCF